ncbi:hypothetical protein A3J41_02955 [candidate division TM6 bacterium RIFCSPHIGHO2_12_FULL_38_8]|nr:MAG: hypothetical protein A3J41_02955 [candidate division TM6 bacterium RIFCSPHIGHO2_12_FULL_38_8]
MKNRLIYYLLLISYFVKAEKTSVVKRKLPVDIDPVMDFRTPFSLNELLHEGLNEVQSLLQQVALVPDANVSELLTRSHLTISAMIDSYDAMVGSSNLHAMYRDDRDFLQTLIDRIDAMIQNLEGGNNIDDQGSQSLSRNIELLSTLRGRLQG